MLIKLSDFLTFTVLKQIPETHQAEAIHFFIYDSIKIILLLIIIVHFMSLVRFYLPVNKMRAFLNARKLYGLEYLFASVFGAITPFCSCSSIPLFIGFLEAGIPLGVTLSFLITSPLINEVAIGLFIGLFGWKVTVMYAIAGILIGIIGGMILGKMKLEKYVSEFVTKPPCSCKGKQKPSGFWGISKALSKDSMKIVRQVVPFVLIGVGVGAVIHGYVPENFFEAYIQKDNIFAVPAAVILAVPLYSNASGVIPIIESLVAKGIPLGTALAFMMAVVGLSLPEALILKKVMKLRLLLSFFGVVTVGIILIGYLFNLII
ncbi:permease [Patescibacteria group bacterium]|nr:permease [Patescibacteria group bacterium]MBU1123452.1 permease [Patescibacteria group bacterium]MBU1910781.1 permease [Patescibacteria group bacterium]